MDQTLFVRLFRYFAFYTQICYNTARKLMSSTYEQQTPTVAAVGVLLFYREADSFGLVAFKSSV